MCKMCDENIYQDLQDIDWVQIPGTKYVAKYKFVENGYKIIVTNLTEIFGECLQEMEIQARFLENNPYAEMKTEVIIRNIKETLENNKTDESTMEVTSYERTLNIQLKFSVHQISFIFNLQPAVLSCEKLKTYVIIPTLSYAMLVHQENSMLWKKVKDLENKIELTSPSKNQQSSLKQNDQFINSSYLSAANMLKAFIEMQNNSKKYFQGEKKATETQNKHSSQKPSSSQEQSIKPVLSIKREIEEVSTPPPEIKYDETVIDNLKQEDSNIASIQESVIKTKKKKKCLKF